MEIIDNAKAKKREYLREYYANNKVALREKQREYYALHAPQLIQSAKDYRVANLDKVKANQRSHYATNKVAYVQRADTYRTTNPERVRQYKRKSAKANPAQGAKNTQKRRTAQLQRIPAWFGEFDEFVTQEAYALAAQRSNACVVWHVDHLFPLRGVHVSGLHCGINLQVIPALLNLQKSNKLRLTQPLEWLRHV